MDEPPHRSERLAHAADPAVLPRTTRAAEGLDRRRFTATDIGTMVEAGIMLEDERVELIGGELVPMSPKGADTRF